LSGTGTIRTRAHKEILFGLWQWSDINVDSTERLVYSQKYINWSQYYDRDANFWVPSTHIYFT